MTHFSPDCRNVSPFSVAPFFRPCPPAPVKESAVSAEQVCPPGSSSHWESLFHLQEFEEFPISRDQLNQRSDPATDAGWFLLLYEDVFQNQAEGEDEDVCAATAAATR